jgi:hypothetical protein
LGIAIRCGIVCQEGLNRFFFHEQLAIVVSAEQWVWLLTRTTLQASDKPGLNAYQGHAICSASPFEALALKNSVPTGGLPKMIPHSSSTKFIVVTGFCLMFAGCFSYTKKTTEPAPAVTVEPAPAASETTTTTTTSDDNGTVQKRSTTIHTGP